MNNKLVDDNSMKEKDIKELKKRGFDLDLIERQQKLVPMSEETWEKVVERIEKSLNEIAKEHEGARLTETELKIIREILDNYYYLRISNQPNIYEFIDLIFNFYNTTSQSNPYKFYNIVGELLLEDSEFFMEKCYIYFFKKIMKLLPIEEMSKYILEKFCFSDEEKIITSFKGRLSVKNFILEGCIFLTNFRVFMIGVMPEYYKNDSIKDRVLKELGIWKFKDEILGSFSGRSPFEKRAKWLRDEKFRQKQLQKDSDEIYRQNFGYQYPIMNAYDIRRSASEIEYRVDLENLKNQKSKYFKFRIKIKPKKEKKENPREFEIKKDKNLSIIEKTLLQT